MSLVANGTKYYDKGYEPLPKAQLDDKIKTECIEPKVHWYGLYCVIFGLRMLVTIY